jgi:aspartyl-tRNA(Asn)/glutamyl-tRNA(Gln) amidotransferase subunit B
MEEGSYRCEVNISMRLSDSEEFGTKVEIKNLNSFRAVERSMEFEIQRQTGLLKLKKEVRHATLGWDEKDQKTVHQRYKEKAPEYRYFPEPDLPDLEFTPDVLHDTAFDLTNIPVRRVRDLIERFGVPPQAADLLVSGPGSPVDNPYFVADFFEQAVQRHGALGTPTANMLTGTVFEYINKTGITLDQTDLTPKKIAEVIKMVSRDELSVTNAKLVISIVLEQGGKVRDIVLSEGLVQVSDEDELVTLVKEVIEENQTIVESVRKGKINAIGALVGEAMKKSDGQANPKRVNEILQEILLKKKS